jgi:hypothetical protein
MNAQICARMLAWKYLTFLWWIRRSTRSRSSWVLPSCQTHTSTFLVVRPSLVRWWSLHTGSDGRSRGDGGEEVLCWHRWGFPSLQHVPSRSVRVWEWGYSGGGEPRVLSPWPPLPLIVLRDRGPTSLLTGWASPIRTRVKGPMGRWAHWWRDQSNILSKQQQLSFRIILL